MSKKVVLTTVAAALLAACGSDTTASRNPAPSTTADDERGTGRVASTDSTANAPTFLWADPPSATAQATAKRATNPSDAARAHVARFAHYYRLSKDQVADLLVKDVHDVRDNVLIVQFTRNIQGVEVFNEKLSVAMDRSFNLIAFTGFVTGDLPFVGKPGHSVREGFLINHDRAIVAALSDLSSVALEPGEVLASSPASGNFKSARLTPAGALRTGANLNSEPSRCKEIFYRQAPDALRPAYYCEADLGND